MRLADWPSVPSRGRIPVALPELGDGVAALVPAHLGIAGVPREVDPLSHHRLLLVGERGELLPRGLGGVEKFTVHNVHDFARRLLEQGVRVVEDDR